MAQLTGLFTLGRDAEVKATTTGTAMVSMAVAYNYGRKDADGKKPSQWVRAAMFGNQAQALAPYLTKGKQVSLVIRDLHIATFQKQDGSTGTSLEGVADFDDFARGPKQSNDGGQISRMVDERQQRPAPAPAPRASSGFDDLDDDRDIPFRDPLAYRGAHLVL